MDSQWRTGGLGYPTGLDYGVIDATARLCKVSLDPTVFVQLREMEHEALRVFAERRRREARK